MHQISDLFFFGTLRDADLFEHVVGAPLNGFDQDAAVLAGYDVRQAINYPFPVLVPDTLGEVGGILVRGLTPDQIQRVVYYETDEYDLYPITVRVGLGAFVSAGAFFASEQLDPSDDIWSMEVWAVQAKRGALIEAEIAMAQYGVLTRDNVNDHWLEFEKQAERIERERFGLAETA